MESQTRRRADSRQKWNTAHGGFLHQFKTRSSAYQHQRLTKRQTPMHECPPDDFIQRIMTSHVLTQAEQRAVHVEQGRGMAASGALKENLLGFHALG